MEILTIFMVTFLLTILALVFQIFYASKSITRSGGSPLPPGKMGLPVLGESIEFVRSLWKGTPERFIQDRIRRYESRTFKTSLLRDPNIVMYGAAGNKFLFANGGKLVRGWSPKTLYALLPYGSLNKNGFKAMARSVLDLEELQKHVGIMDYMARTHLKAKWHGRKQVMVHPMAKDYTFTLACRLLLSTEDWDFIAGLADPMHKLIAGIFCIPINLPWTQFGQAIRASKFVNTRLTSFIRKRRQELLLAVEKELINDKDIASDHQDILSHMLLDRDESGQYTSDIELADWIMGLLIASHDSTSVVITTIFKYLAESPEIYHNVFREQMEIARNKADGELLNWHDILKMKYSWNVAREAMRIYPPGPLVFREAISDFTYAGYHVPKDWKVLLSIHSTHRDSKYFPDPEKFDPSRFEKDGPLPYTFVPFGGGPGMCPGRSYAQIEILAFLHNVVKMFKWETIHPDEEIILDPVPRPAKGLPVYLHPHQTHHL